MAKGLEVVVRRVVIPAIVSVVAMVGFLWWAGSRLSVPRSDRDSPAHSVRMVEQSSVGMGQPEAEFFPGRSRADPGPQPSTELGRGALNTPILRGTVRSAEGALIPGADVFLSRERGLWSRDAWGRVELLKSRVLGKAAPEPGDGVVAQAKTNAQGVYSLEVGELPAERYQVLVRHTEYAPVSEMWNWQSDGGTLDFRLALGDQISGYVVDGSGKRIAGAVVEAYRSDGRRRGFRRSRMLRDRATTGRDGAFRLSVANGTFQLRAQAEGYTHSLVSDVAVGTEELKVKLSSATTIAGRVVNGEAEPLDDVNVTLYSGRGSGGRGRRWRPRTPANTSEPTGAWRWWTAPRAEAKTAADGIFRFENAPAERFYVVATKPGYVAAQWGGNRSPQEGSEGVVVAESEVIEIRLETGIALRGVVSDSRGQPVRGAFVAIGTKGGKPPWARFRQGGSEGEHEWPEPVSIFSLVVATETDAQGHFTFDSLAGDIYSLSVQAEAHPIYRLDDLSVEAESEALDVVLDRGVTLGGKVVSSRDGATVAGARIAVRVSDFERRFAVSKEDGSYEITGLNPRSISEIRVEAARHSTGVFEDVEVDESPARQEFSIELDPAVSVVGKVMDGNGAPVFGARVSLVPRLEADFNDRTGARRTYRQMFAQTKRTQTNVDGEFRLDEIASFLSFTLTVHHSDFLPFESESIEMSREEGVHQVELLLSRGTVLETHVFNAEGVALAGGRVYVERRITEDERRVRESQSAANSDGLNRDVRRMRRRYERQVRREVEGSRRRRRLSGAGGKAIFSGLHAGDYIVTVSADRHQKYHAMMTTVADEVVSLRVDLLSESAMTGRVVDTRGEPIANVELRARRNVTVDNPTAAEGQAAPQRSERSDGRSAADGTFRLGQLGEGGLYSVRARASGYATARFSNVPADSDLPIVLNQLGGVAGSVVSTELREPIVAFRVRLVRNTAGASEDAANELPRELRRWRSIDDFDGLFTLDDVPPGSYFLEVVATDHTGESIEVVVREGEVTDDADVQLRSGLVVRGQALVLGRDEAVPGAEIYMLSLSEESSDDEEREESVARGRTRDRQNESGRPSADRTARAGESRPDHSAASARQREAEAQMAYEVLRVAKRTRNRDARTNDSGLFEVSDLRPGRYWLVADAVGFLPKAVEVSISDSVVVPDLLMECDPGQSLEGNVELVQGQAAVGVTLVLRHKSGMVRRVDSDEQGRYSIGGLLTGEHMLRVRIESAPMIDPVEVSIGRGVNRFDVQPGR